MADPKKPRRRSQTRDAAAQLRRQLREYPVSVPLTDVLDPRTVLGRTVRDMTEDLLTSLGGRDHVSVQRQLLVEQIVRVKVLVDAYDAALFIGLDPTDKDTRAFVQDASRLRYLLAGLLDRAGLDAVPPPVKSIHEILAESSAKSGTS